MLTNCPGSKKSVSIPAKGSDIQIEKLFSQYPHSFHTIIKKKDDFNVGVIYAQIDRKKDQGVEFTDHYFNVDKEIYFCNFLSSPFTIHF